MKKLTKIPAVLVAAAYLLIKLPGTVFHPLEDLPAPDFNDAYDLTML